MTCFDTDPNLRWLLCVTHPDDEIAIAAWLRRLARQGNEVFLSWTHTTEERTYEATQAARTIGVPQERLRFHQGRDGYVLEDIPNLLPSFQQMVGEVQPDRVIVGAYEQGHLDHDATNFLVAQTYSGPKLEIPLYHAYHVWYKTLNEFADPAGEEILCLTEEEEAFKNEMAHAYPSQTIGGALVWYALGRRLQMKPMELKTKERMRVQTHFDFLRPNLPPELAEKVMRCKRWKRWEAAIRGLGR